MKTIKIFHALPLLPIAFMAPAVAADDVIQLNPVVVTATSLEQNIVDAPSAMSIITRKELDNRPVHDLVDALQGTESIQFTGEGMTRRGISIRGMPTSHTLILLDGKRISSAGAIAHSDYDYNWMPVEAIERIEVVRGPISSLYGSDALGGVVNVIPRKPTDEWKGSLRLGGGLMDHNRGGGSHQEGIYLGGPVIKDKLGISFTGTNQRREATKDPADPTISELEGRQSHQGDMTVVFTPFDNHRFDIGYGSGREKRWRDTKTSGSSPKNYQSNETIEREQQSFKYEGDWDWGNTIIRAYRNRLDRNVRYTNNQKPSDPNTTIKNSIVDFHANLTAIDRHTVSFGGEWHEEELESQGFANDGASAIYRSFFIQEQYAITPD
ncbi:MAG: TonB-dependent receptor plug domain-containing protein, partial [Oxalobacter sp.]|nr:TonB-dependent receptor plug domain-containing protein [Oxalobacter sp.]